MDQLFAQAEIGKRRAAEGAPEHEGERGRVLVAEVDRDRGDGFARREARHGAKQAGLLSPRHEAHASFAPEQAREGAAAHAERLGPCIDRLVDVRLLRRTDGSSADKGPCAGKAQRQRQDRQLLHLILDQLHQRAGAPFKLVFEREAQGLRHEAPHERRDADDLTTAWHVRRPRPVPDRGSAC